MELALLASLLISNAGWLLYLDRRDKREKNERKSLHNRIADPKLIELPDEVIASNLEEKTTEMPVDPDPPEEVRAEYAAIGVVDPPLMRGDED
jgi:hypothetical protein